MQDEQDMTVAEVSKMLRVHRMTVLHWLERGIFPHAYKLPSRAGWRIPRADIEALKKEVA
jgi:excisionase family DNA binding protein